MRLSTVVNMETWPDVLPNVNLYQDFEPTSLWSSTKH